MEGVGDGMSDDVSAILAEVVHEVGGVEEEEDFFEDDEWYSDEDDEEEVAVDGAVRTQNQNVAPVPDQALNFNEGSMGSFEAHIREVALHRTRIFEATEAAEAGPRWDVLESMIIRNMPDDQDVAMRMLGLHRVRRNLGSGGNVSDELPNDGNANDHLQNGGNVNDHFPNGGDINNHLQNGGNVNDHFPKDADVHDHLQNGGNVNDHFPNVGDINNHLPNGGNVNDHFPKGADVNDHLPKGSNFIDRFGIAQNELAEDNHMDSEERSLEELAAMYLYSSDEQRGSGDESVDGHADVGNGDGEGDIELPMEGAIDEDTLDATFLAPSSIPSSPPSSPTEHKVFADPSDPIHPSPLT